MSDFVEPVSSYGSFYNHKSYPASILDFERILRDLTWMMMMMMMMSLST